MTDRLPRGPAHELDFNPPVPAVAAIGGTPLPLQDPGVQVWRVPLQAGDETLARLVELLPAHERNRMDAIRGEAPRRRFAVAHGTLRLLLAHHLRERPRELVFALRAHGKPYLPAAPFLEFNLTHSHELALIALSRVGAVGIDVEGLARKQSDLRAVSRRVLSTSEQQWLDGVGEAAQAAAFLQLWACKEAVSKAAGSGFSAGFSAIEIDPRLSPGQPQVVRAAGGTWRLCTLAPGDGYVAALAVAAPAAGAS
jgi:4'-phosphopantetheinyl transferase